MPRLPRELETLARMLAYMLSHRPDEFGLVLAEGGWVQIKHLLQALHEEPGFARVRREHLERVAALTASPRLEVAGERVRVLTPQPPELRHDASGALPPALYLAISPKVHALVWEQGLKAPATGELVLARLPEMARRLGKRRSPAPILVTVQTPAAAREGVVFKAYGEELFLASAPIPREFLHLPAPPKEMPPPRPGPKPQARPTPGTVLLDLPQMLAGKPLRGKKRDEAAWKAGTRALRKRGKKTE